MSNAIVVGTQWGDEGKGKIVDLITERFDVVARYQGGHNAGHTVVVGDRKRVLHLIPSGILHPGKVCVIGNGVVIDPFALLKEVEALEEEGLELEGRLFVSNRAHLIMPYHMAIEAAEEQRLGEARIGTTSRGIGPCYEDKMARRGIRVGDLRDLDAFRDRLQSNLKLKNKILTRIYGAKPLDSDEILERYRRVAPGVLRFMADTAEYLQRATRAGRSILLEGAQGTLLDIDHGTYPFVTSSNASAGGACSGTGLGPGQIDGVLGISKAYTTRVGSGPFPTELDDEVGEAIRRRGAEFGATTGRPRRCGWFDAAVGRYAARINGLTTLVITKLDVLDELEEIRVCTGYEMQGRPIGSFPMDVAELERVRPVYESHPGWQRDTSGVTEYADLPRQARDYLSRLAEIIETDISIISLGPKRDATIILEESPNLQSLFSRG